VRRGVAGLLLEEARGASGDGQAGDGFVFGGALFAGCALQEGASNGEEFSAGGTTGRVIMVVDGPMSAPAGRQGV